MEVAQSLCTSIHSIGDTIVAIFDKWFAIPGHAFPDIHLLVDSYITYFSFASFQKEFEDTRL